MSLAANHLCLSIKALLTDRTSNLVIQMALVIICLAIILFSNIKIQFAIVIHERRNVLYMLDLIEFFNSMLMPDRVIDLEIIRMTMQALLLLVTVLSK